MNQDVIIEYFQHILYILSLVSWKGSLMMSGFVSYYLNLVSITFMQSLHLFLFQRNVFYSSMQLEILLVL